MPQGVHVFWSRTRSPRRSPKYIHSCSYNHWMTFSHPLFALIFPRSPIFNPSISSIYPCHFNFILSFNPCNFFDRLLFHLNFICISDSNDCSGKDFWQTHHYRYLHPHRCHTRILAAPCLPCYRDRSPSGIISKLRRLSQHSLPCCLVKLINGSGVYILFRKRYLPPPPFRTAICFLLLLCPFCCNSSLFCIYFTLLLSIFSFSFPFLSFSIPFLPTSIYFLFLPFSFLFLPFFPLSSFYFSIFPYFLFPLHIFPPNEICLYSPRGGKNMGETPRNRYRTCCIKRQYWEVRWIAS